MSSGVTTTDPRVTSAIHHWAPRFVAQGVVLSDFEDVTSSLTSWDDWCAAWSARAAVHEKLGREALADKKVITAAEHLQRAGVYYHFGKFLFVQDLAQMKAAHMKAVECRNLALPYLKAKGRASRCRMRQAACQNPASPEASKPPVLVFACGLDPARRRPRPTGIPILARIRVDACFGCCRARAKNTTSPSAATTGRIAGVIDYIRDLATTDASHWHSWHQPRRLLRAARGGVREAHQGVPGARRPLRLGRELRRRAGTDQRDVPRALQEGDHGGGAQACRDADAARRRAEHHLSDLHHERQARPHRACLGDRNVLRARSRDR
jgi:hypothetical protein